MKRTAEEPAKDEKPLRPAQCRTYLRKQLAGEFREIVSGFVKEAKQGSCQHVKLVTELLDSQPAKKSPQRGGRKLLATWASQGAEHLRRDAVGEANGGE